MTKNKVNTIKKFRNTKCQNNYTLNYVLDAKCLLPMEPGPCRMSLNRFYYNAQTDTCEEFKFGGCRGNDNKFGFKQTCEEACKKSISPGTASPTTAPKNDMTSKQLSGNTLKTLTSVVESSTSTTTTTLKPKTTRTAVNSKTTTSRSRPTTATSTTQKTKTQI